MKSSNTYSNPYGSDYCNASASNAARGNEFLHLLVEAQPKDKSSESDLTAELSTGEQQLRKRAVSHSSSDAAVDPFGLNNGRSIDTWETDSREKLKKIASSEELKPVPSTSTSPRTPTNIEMTNLYRDPNLVERFVKSFAFGKAIISEFNGNAGFAERKTQAENDYESSYCDLSIPYTSSLKSKADLDYDSLDLDDFLTAIKNPSLRENAKIGLRIVIFSILPSFILVQHSNTSSWFTAGQLIPSLAASYYGDHLGGQIRLTVTMLQVVSFLSVWGTFIYFIQLDYSSIAWWFTAFLLPFSVGLLGDVPGKRMMMVYGVMMLEFSRQKKTDPTFALRYCLDLLIGTTFAFFTILLPWPIFTYLLVDEKMNELHASMASALQYVIQSFWEPVLLDAEIWREKISSMNLRDDQEFVKSQMRFIPFEPVEFGCKNLFREERLKHFTRIRWHLHNLRASAGLDTKMRHESILVPLTPSFRETQSRLQSVALKLSAEIVKTLNALGNAISPDEVRHIDFDLLADLGTALEDVINSERERTIFSKKFSGKETNALFRLFAFHSTIVEVVGEILKIESWAVNFDSRTCPSWYERTLNFAIVDYWNDFWRELPNRVLLRTPKDARIVKDAFRFSLGLVVAVSFARWSPTTNDAYYFGMSILSRLALQTASETLQVGVMRICGLAFGAAFAYFVGAATDKLWQSALLVSLFGFLCHAASRHPVYGNIGQYAIAATIGALPPQRFSSDHLLNRITANIFAFLGYLIVCLVIFPVDPFRVVSNYRTKVVKNANEVTQTLVVLGCCPLTRSGEESKYLLAQVEGLLKQQQENLLEALEWNDKAAAEPTVRGGLYPDNAYKYFFTKVAQMSSLQYGLLDSMRVLHRRRVAQPSIMVYGIFELIRPFLIDVAKLVRKFFQLIIDSAEAANEWEVQRITRQLWKGELAVVSLSKVTGRIQQTLLAALLPHHGASRNYASQYVSADLMESSDRIESFDSSAIQGSFSSLMRSFQIALRHTTIDRDDFCVFECIVVNFIVLMSILTDSLKPVIQINNYEVVRRE